MSAFGKCTSADRQPTNSERRPLGWFQGSRAVCLVCLATVAGLQLTVLASLLGHDAGRPETLLVLASVCGLGLVATGLAGWLVARNRPAGQEPSENEPTGVAEASDGGHDGPAADSAGSDYPAQVGGTLPAMTEQYLAALERARELTVQAGEREARIAAARREAEALTAIARDLAGSLERDQLLQRVVDGACELTGSDLAHIAVRQEKTAEFKIEALVGARDPGWLGLSAELPFGLDRLSLRSPAGEDLESPDEASPDRQLEASGEGIVSQAMVPVRLGVETIALLYVSRRNDRAYSDVELSHLSRLADHAALALRNARLFAAEAAARAEAEAATRVKSQFLANVSHEIRTPMNGVIGLTGLLLESELTDDQRELAQMVKQSADALLTILNDILDFSKIEAGKLELEAIEFEPRQVVEEVADLLAEVADRKGLDLATLVEPDVPTLVEGDPGRLRQVLVNLIGNAIKFTQQGEVTVRLSREAGGDLLRFEVRDTGIGIEPSALGRLFQSFTQADGSTTRRFGGTGLGLSISKQLVELMGGEIGVDSVPGQGSTFWFCARLPERAASPGSEAGLTILRGRRALVVAQPVLGRQMLVQQLAAWEMDASGVEPGAAALDRIEAATQAGEPIDVVLLHVARGAEASGSSVSLSRGMLPGGTKLVLLTSVRQHHARVGEMIGGADTELIRPVRQAALFDCLVRVLDNRRNGLPRKAVPAAGAVLGAPKRVATSSPLLLVEDNPVNQRVAGLMLERLGYRVEVVGNGREALEAHAPGRFAAILMDCQMPEMDGFEATLAIRQREQRTLRTPIIAMTASALHGERERCLAAGMDDYLSKPITASALEDVVRRWTEDEVADGGSADDARAISAEDDAVLLALDRLRGEFGDEFLWELVDLFRTDVPIQLAGLRQALATGELVAVRRAAHRIKGSVVNLGAERAAALSGHLEQCADAGTAEELPALLTELSQELEEVERLLGRLERGRAA